MRDESNNFGIHADWLRSVELSASICWEFGGLDRSQRDQIVFVNGDDEENYQQIVAARLNGVRNPILIISFQDLSCLNKKHPILGSSGVFFLRLPVDRSDLETALSSCSKGAISEEELATTQRWFCFSEEWRAYSHSLGNLLKDWPESSNQIQEIVSKWSESILRFAKDQIENLEAFKQTINCPSEPFDLKESRRRLEVLDVGLRLKEKPVRSSIGRVYPKRPPKGYSKLLIADDNLQMFLPAMLERKYRYDVIRPQAMKLGQAKQLLDERDPRVVLADLYFKKSERATETPEKAVGEEFIKYAMRDPNRLVLVTSKASVTEVLAGSFNCSGAEQATNPEFVHQAIWAAAESKGVTDAELIDGNAWTPQAEYLDQLSLFGEQLPDLKEQWRLFPKLITEALNLTRLLEVRTTGPEKELVTELGNLLSSFGGQNDFSLRQIKELFQTTNEIHRKARLSDTEVNNNIRNILHGKIEQFSSEMNAADFLISSLKELVEMMDVLGQRSEITSRLDSVLDAYSIDVPMIPFLSGLDTIIQNESSGISDIRRKKARDGHGKTPEKIKVIVAEDTEYWSNQVRRIISELSEVYAGECEFELHVTDNAAEAYALAEPKSQTSAMNETTGGVRTIAVLDICLPRDPEHADAIRSASNGDATSFESPSSEFGLDLIRKLTEFEFNIPTIVFSTIDNIEDRKKVCGWGVPTSNFISKGPGATSFLERALVRYIEKSQRYIITRRIVGDKESFFINNKEIELSGALCELFSALYDLAQIEDKVTVDALVNKLNLGRQGDPKSSVKKNIHNIRKKIFETSQKYRFYVDAHQVIKTVSASDGFAYQVTAQIPTYKEETYDTWEEDLDEVNQKNRLLVIGSENTFSEIGDALARGGYNVAYSSHFDTDLIAAFEPHVSVIDRTAFKGEGSSWAILQTILNSLETGVIFVLEEEDPIFVNSVLQLGIPLDNILLRQSKEFVSRLIRSLETERLRVFVGDSPIPPSDTVFPIVEIMDGTDFEQNLLNLSIGEVAYSIKPRKKSYLAAILTRLVQSPGMTIGWDAISDHIAHPVTEDDRKNWTKRLREILVDEWQINDAMVVLESSADGLRLNIRVLDLRTTKP
ncbi:MAG: hypothetical protein IPM59_09350 [Chloracidobacterium sp.]|nr:hypothetical protein [Chloracidobacterium sp.]